MSDLPPAIASWRDQIGFEARRLATIGSLLLALTSTAFGGSRTSDHGGWGIGGSDCRFVYPAREAETEAWLAGYRSGIDDIRGAGEPQASLGFNAVKEFCEAHPDATLDAAARAVFLPLRRR